MKRLVVTGCAAVFACAANAGVVDSVDTLIGGSTAAHVPGGTHPYGVCAHITGWGEPLVPTMNAMELAGMLWTVGKDVERTIRFTGGAPTFRNMYGRKIAVREVEKGVYKLKLTGSPIYFSGAELVGL